MGGIALVLILSGTVVIRGALKGLNPVDAFRDIFDRSFGGPGIAAPVRVDPAFAALDAGRHAGAGGGPDFPPNVERWRGLVATYFPPGVVNEALSVMECESRGNPAAINPLSQASGLFQHLPKFWDDRSRRAGVPGGNIFDPNANVRVAAWLYRQSNTWAHWSCKPSV